MLHGPLIGSLMVSSLSLMGASWPLLVSWSLHGSLWSPHGPLWVPSWLLMIPHGSPMASHSSIMAPCGPHGPSWTLRVLHGLSILSCLLHGSLIIPSWYLMDPEGPSWPLTVPSCLPHRHLISTSWPPCGPSWPLTDPSWSLMAPHSPLMAQPLPTELCLQRVHAAPSLPLSPLSEVEPRPRSYGWLCPSNMPRS